MTDTFERLKAALADMRFAELWAEADAEFQPMVDTALARIAAMRE